MGDTKAARAARGAKRTVRRRAVGMRERIVSHLMAVGVISDPTGMASTKLAEAVGYPGSSVAFAQLLSGMERDGLVAREVRGKRTYRITLPEAVAVERTGTGLTALPSALALPDQSQAGDAPVPGEDGLRSAGGIDYDELARRLLVQVLRKLASVPEADIAAADAPGALAEENARLREQLTQTQRALELERARRSPLSGELNQSDVVVLEHLLDPGATA